ncbi:MAG: ATP-dependent Clp protease adaptor ClpS [Planctomycetes bacterium]|nr:ATP-dependent Clp protease adaptor ClpS [Planctomycetota bacterium]
MPSTAPLPTKLPKVTNKEKTRLAPLWKVLFHNDDKTTMDFVVGVLMKFFGHDIDKAMQIMLEVHNTGIGLAGTYPKEIAELKMEQCISAARPKFPLKVTIEPVEE